MKLFRSTGHFLIPIMLSIISFHAPAQEPVDMAEYFVGIIYKGYNWKPYSAPGAPELQAAHRANIERLEASGQMLMAGPMGADGEMRGLFFYKAASLEEAQQLVNTDPAVMAGQLKVELHSWWGPKSLESLP